MVHRLAVCFNDADCEPNGNTTLRLKTLGWNTSSVWLISLPVLGARLWLKLYRCTNSFWNNATIVEPRSPLVNHFEANHERLLLALFLCFHALLLSADFSSMKFKRMQTTSWVPFDLLGQVRHEELKKLPCEKPSVWKSFRVKCTSAYTFGVFGLFASGCKGAFVLCHNSDCRVHSEILGSILLHFNSEAVSSVSSWTSASRC